jgi:hypothetical protein
MLMKFDDLTLTLVGFFLVLTEFVVWKEMRHDWAKTPPRG